MLLRWQELVVCWIPFIYIVGSGKTVAFLIPMLEKLKEHHSTGGVRGIVLSPTRELAYQSYQVCRKISHFTNLRACVIVGGESIEQHFEAISKNPDIIFATPGRLMHLLMEVPNFNLKSVQFISFFLFFPFLSCLIVPSLSRLLR